MIAEILDGALDPPHGRVRQADAAVQWCRDTVAAETPERCATSINRATPAIVNETVFSKPLASNPQCFELGKFVI